MFIVASLVGPPESGAVLDVTQNRLGTCALRRDGAAVCWGQHSSFPAFVGARGSWSGGEVIGEPRLGKDIPTLRAVALSSEHGWGVTQEGHVVVWGPFSDASDRAKPRVHALRRMGTVADAVDVVAFDGGACVRLRDGDLACWRTAESARDDHAPAPPRRLRDERGARLPAGPLRELASGDFAIGEGSDRVVVIARSVRSLLDPKADEPSDTARVQRSPSAHSGPEIGVVELYERQPCALEGGQLHCDATCVATVVDRDEDATLQRPVIEVELPSDFRAVELYASREKVCARSDAHDVACWTHRPSARQLPARRAAHWLDLTAWVLDESS